MAYDRDISKLLVQASSLAYQQYYCWKSDHNYDGKITDFPLYERVFSEYTQVTSFKSYNFSLESQIDESYDKFQDKVYDMFKFFNPWMPDNSKEYKTQNYSSYLGFLLTSDDKNIFAFRGVRTNFEKKISTEFKQFPCKLGNKCIGNIALAPSLVYMKNLYNKQSLQQQIYPWVEKLLDKDKDKPWYITGHSFGGALAILTALDLVMTYGISPNKVFMYSYGGSGVGDPQFASYYDDQVPNSYRVVNTQDSAPSIPMRFAIYSGDGNYKYRHVGQEFSFRKEAYPPFDPRNSDREFNAILEERNHLDMISYTKKEPQVDPYYTAVTNELENPTDE